MFKNENGFSLVELAIAAGLAVALAATAVTILSGTTASLSSNANGAAGTSSQYNADVLANASGAAGNNNVAAPTFAEVAAGYTVSPYNPNTSWTSASPVIALENQTFSGDKTYGYQNLGGVTGYPITVWDKAVIMSDMVANYGMVQTGPNEITDTEYNYVYDFSDAYKVVKTNFSVVTSYYLQDADGNMVAL